ncbi:MAG: HD-GYP domain-containing protein, partial [Anaerolineae bacterium]|nr:HD-GYP domain-containing protein [Anaerolineae bacterium]
ILGKPDALTGEERRIMEQHTEHGRRLLMSVKGLDPAAVDVAHAHHERMNGTGYPRG